MQVAGREHFAAQRSYFMFYGLVFGLLSNPVMQQSAGKIIVPWSVEKTALHSWREDQEQEVVVLLQALSHPCNINYDFSVMRILAYFNGKAVNNLKELKALALAAEAGKEEFMRFTFTPLADADAAGNETDPDIVLHRDMCANADLTLMHAHNIRSRYSEDLEQKLPSATPPADDSDDSVPDPSLNPFGEQMLDFGHEGDQMLLPISEVPGAPQGAGYSSRSNGLKHKLESGSLAQISTGSIRSGHLEVPMPFYNGIRQL